MAAGPSNAVRSARARRASRSGRVEVDMELFVEDVEKRIDLTIRQRVIVAAAFLADRIVKNISVPVVKQVVTTKSGQSRTRVTERSKRGEFPRADTTTLERSIEWDITMVDKHHVLGHVLTPVWYSMPLEILMERQFLTRTLNEEKERITKILTGPIV